MIEPYAEDAATGTVLYLGDCVEVMAELPAESVAAVITDPPYGLEFMGKDWDRFEPRAFEAWCTVWAREALRVLTPGGHLLAFGGTRTAHRLVSGIEDAGFEIRDTVAWLYGVGFPKSLDISKAIDAAAGAEREIVGQQRLTGTARGHAAARTTASEPYEVLRDSTPITAPATDLAREWAGWGTALKPAFEPCVLARKPIRGTYAENVTRYGTGALNIDATRIATGDNTERMSNAGTNGDGWGMGKAEHVNGGSPLGRWPSNVILGCACDGDHAETCASRTEPRRVIRNNAPYQGVAWGNEANPRQSEGYADNACDCGWRHDAGCAVAMLDAHADEAEPSRFFYTAKASRSEREAGLEGFEPKRRTDGRDAEHESGHLRTSKRRNDHPTVKPVALMRYLIRLTVPPGGRVLDPFMGSGSTRIAALAERRPFTGIELDPDYLDIAAARAAQIGLL